MRVTENSTMGVVRDSLNRSRLRMADLEKQNASLKRLNAPSDDPAGNVKLMSIRNESLDNTQFEKNSNLAKTFLNFSDSSLDELNGLMIRAKELALGQSSAAANGPESRKMVAEEIQNLLEQTKAISNRRLGDRYIFGGYKTNVQPFDDEGKYFGDDGNIMVEVQKDVFVGMNMPGQDIFIGKPKADQKRDPAQVTTPELAMQQTAAAPSENIFRTLDGLRVGLLTNNIDMIRSTLEPLDAISSRIVSARAQLGSRVGGIDAAISNMSRAGVFNAELQSSIEDADLIQVVSDMAKEETVLKASLSASSKLIQPTLLDFLR
jgi:flagellar hook-associated protein 3 FlgL